jgi:serine/threonine-protein kinase
MVYVANSRLYSRLLDEAEATELQGTENAASPFFSPDGRWVGFVSQGRLKKVSLAGGGVDTISEGAGFVGGSATWGEDDSIIATAGIGVSPLVRVPASGGKAEPLGDLYREQNEGVQAYPQALPGGKLLLYTGRALAATADDAFTVALSLPDLGRKVVQRNAAMARYATLPDGSGYLLHVNRGTLFATPFDPARPETGGSSAPVIQDVVEYATTGAQFDVSTNGTLIYQRGRSGGGTVSLQWMDSAGKLQPIIAKPGPFGRPQVSPDGTRLAMDNVADIWTYDWQREIMTRLTFDGGQGSIWSRDGRFVLFSGNGGIGWTRSDGGSRPQALIQSANLTYPWSF